MSEAITAIQIEFLRRGKYQPRRFFDPVELQELADSIEAQGLVQPVTVRATSTHGVFEIVAGERRWRACQLASLLEVECIVRDYTDEQAANIALIENIQRVDLNPIEEAEQFQIMIDEFNYSHLDIASAVGKSRASVSNSLRLLKLTQDVKDYLIKGEIEVGHAKTLASMPREDQLRLAIKTVNKSLTVRGLERLIKKEKTEKNNDDCKSMDLHLKRLEEKVSNHIGNPVHLEKTPEGKWTIQITAHSSDELDGILTERLGFHLTDN